MTETSTPHGEHEPANAPESDEQSPAPPQRPLLRQDSRATLLLCALFLGLLALSHWRQQLAFPEMGSHLAAGLGLALALVMGLAASLKKLRALACAPSLLFLAWLAWAVCSFAWSASPADGLSTMGTWIEGYWVFCATILIWRAAGAMQALPAPGAEDNSLTPRLTLGPRDMAALAFFAFFALTAVASAARGLEQFFYSYDQQLTRLASTSAFADERLRAGLLHALREKRIASFYGNPNVHCYILALCAPFILGLLATRSRLWAQGAWALALPLTLAAIYLTKSRGGWLCALIVLTLAAGAIGLQRWKRLARPLAFAAFIGLGCWTLYLFGGAPGHTPDEPAKKPAREQIEAGFWKRLTRSSTVRERIHYAEAALRQMRHAERSPLTGNGLGSYGALYALTRSEGAGESRYAHNAPLQLYVEGGAPGLALFALLYFGALALAARGLLQRERDDAALPIRAMACAALVGFGLSALFDYAFYFREYFLDGCLLMGWVFAVRLDEKETRKAAPARGWKARLSALTRNRVLTGALLALWIAANATAGWLFLLQPMRAAAAANLAGDYAESAARLTREGNAQGARDELAYALEHYQRASSIQGNDCQYYGAQAGVMEQLGRPEDALRAREIAMRLNPLAAYLRRDQAMTLMRLNRLDAAMAMANEAVRLHPLNPEGHAVKGQILKKMGRKEQAAAQFEQAAELETYHPEVYRTMIEQ